MKLSILAARDLEAQNRIVAAAEELAAGHDLGDQITRLESIQERDPRTKAMFQREAVADLLEALAEVQPVACDEYVRLSDLDDVDGVGPKTVALIREHFSSGAPD